MSTNERQQNVSARVAVVTGANKGIGKAIAAGLLDHGFVVYVGARDADRGREATEELAAAGDARALQLDVTSDEQVVAAVSCVEEEFGRLDVLVNNAGINVGYRKPTEESAASLRSVYET